MQTTDDNGRTYRFLKEEDEMVPKRHKMFPVDFEIPVEVKESEKEIIGSQRHALYLKQFDKFDNVVNKLTKESKGLDKRTPTIPKRKFEQFKSDHAENKLEKENDKIREKTLTFLYNEDNEENQMKDEY